MKHLLGGGLLLAVGLAGAFFWWVSRPMGIANSAEISQFYADAKAQDVAAGRLVFAAAGCASCHLAPESAPSDPPVLAGGTAFVSDFGTFYAPNISSDPDYGIGAWQIDSFARALLGGVSPNGRHYYPAFPYTAYAGMRAQDVANLFAYMQTLPAAQTPSRAHEVGFPFNIRRGIGLWKRRYMPSPSAKDRGAYLVETLAHCGECHTPRDAFGGLDRARWLQGAPNPSGTGTIPGLTPAQLAWSEADIVEYLTSGFTPEYDSAGGKMVAVIENLAQLPGSDRAAIAAYLLALPAP